MCVCVCVCVCVCTHLYVYMPACMHTCMHACLIACVCVCVCAHAQARALYVCCTWIGSFVLTLHQSYLHSISLFICLFFLKGRKHHMHFKHVRQQQRQVNKNNYFIFFVSTHFSELISSFHCLPYLLLSYLWLQPDWWKYLIYFIFIYFILYLFYFIYIYLIYFEVTIWFKKIVYNKRFACHYRIKMLF